jgi:magnesium-transporting ATPase (P-type)
VFFYRLLKYYWSDDEQIFKLLNFDLSDMTHVQIRSKFAKGLNQETVCGLRDSYGENQTRVPIKPVISLLSEQFIGIFNVFQLSSVVLWYLDDYASYATIILVMSIFSIVIAVYQTRKNQKDLNQMSIYNCPIVVYRAYDANGMARIKNQEQKLVLERQNLAGGSVLTDTPYSQDSNFQKKDCISTEKFAYEINSEELVIGDIIEIPVY